MIVTFIASIVALLVGLAIGYLLSQNKNGTALQSVKDEEQRKFAELEKEYTAYKASTEVQLQSAIKSVNEKQAEVNTVNEEKKNLNTELQSITGSLSAANANLDAANETIKQRLQDIQTLRADLQKATTDLGEAVKNLATEKANNSSLKEKLQKQEKDLEQMGKKIETEFENIANRILENKTEKFTELNKTKLNEILEPLGKNIEEFKKTVNETYDKESKERFSLGEKVKELTDLNKQLSDDAKGLTKALKGEAKTQGRWGEIILESILQKSGLRKDEEYFMEYQLTDQDGNPLKSDHEGKKMRPDAVVKYPDNRSVIIDAKVSLNAYIRYTESDDVEQQKAELQAHVEAIKSHILTLSARGYDDYDKALDFVMMFIPNEPAYMAAMQGDPNLWNFAYDKRILLISPTNLITALKLIVDLWKREYQNRNAKAIAERGAKLYDKFVGFVSNLEEVGEFIGKALGKYNEAHKQLTTGNDNLVLQATKLKSLGLKTKRELSPELVDNSTLENETES